MTTLGMTLTTNGQVLSGKTILVTGAAKRLGRAIALAAAQNGADVAITYRESAREARAVVSELAQHDVDALAVRCDVTDEKSVRAMVKEVARELGGIDVLVNNAANYETAEFEKITVAQWDAIFASNTRGPFLVSREALPYLRKRRGRIVNMGSLGGLRPWATHAHYCSSKAALHMLTKVMAKALAPEIAVNAVAPGMIDLGERSAASFMKKMAKQTPMQRNGTAADIAAAVMFFCGSAVYYRAGAGRGWWAGAVEWQPVMPLRSVSGHRSSDAASSSESDAPLRG
jgi:3-oxoacyl-[acyl-carrier protein] reductase/pteridine reductase